MISTGIITEGLPGKAKLALGADPQILPGVKRARWELIPSQSPKGLRCKLSARVCTKEWKKYNRTRSLCRRKQRQRGGGQVSRATHFISRNERNVVQVGKMESMIHWYASFELAKCIFTATSRSCICILRSG